MMTDAVVVRTVPVREHDLLAVLYCRESGRTAAVAKGTLRHTSRQAAALDDGNLIRCRLMPGRTGVPIVTGAQVLRSWTHAKSSLASWAAAQVLLEALDAAVYDEQTDERLWSSLVGSLESLDAGHRPLDALREGEATMLEALGYGRHAVPAGRGAVRTELDDSLERVIQRRLHALPLFYRVAERAG